MPTVHRAATCAPLLLLLACGGPASSGEVPEWTLSAEPTLSIGEDGTPEGEFDRVSTALALPGDEIAVVDAGASEIRIFSGAGGYLRTLGRQGEGPGEFTGITWVQLDHDTLVVYDGSARRITMLGLDGTVHATIIPRPAADGITAMPVARSADGSWVVRAMLLGLAPQLATAPEGAPPPSGVTRDTAGVGFLSASGEGSVNFVVRVPGQPMVAVPGGPVGLSVFSAPVVVARGGDRLAVADPASGSLWWFSSDGAEESRGVIGIPRRPLAPSGVDSMRREAVDATPSPRGKAIMEAMFSTAAAPGQLPIFTVALSDGDSQLWLEEWHLGVPPRSRYHAIEADGAWRASILMPEGFRPTAIGPDWVLGIHRDADGLERVKRYGLNRR